MSGGGGKQTTGYTYRMGVHFIPSSLVDVVVAIKVGDRIAWTGTVTANSTLSINSPGLFGGPSGEGGVVGTLDVMMGAQTQTDNAYLTAQGVPATGFRGLLSLVYRGIVAQNNPYPKPWAFRVQKAVQGWGPAGPWYSAKAVIPITVGSNTIAAMNPAHIILKCCVHPAWGMGYPLGAFDLTAFTAAADALYAEGFGLCLYWARQDTVQAFIQIVLNHIGGVLTEDRSTGLIKLKLIRADYDPATLPLYADGTGLLDITTDDVTDYAGAVNEIVVAWNDPISNTPGSATAQNIAAIQAAGRILSETRQYPGLPTVALAERVALRDVTISSAGLRRYTLTFDRRGASIAPGDVFTISAPDRQIASMVLRAVTADYGTPTRGTVTITATQDVYGLPAVSYLGAQTGTWIDPDRSAQPASAQALFEAPYVQLVTQIGSSAAQALDPAAGYAAAVGAVPAGVPLNYALETKLSSETSYAQRAVEDFAPTGTLVAALPRAAAGAVGVALANVSRLDLVATGTLALLDAELLRVDAIDAVANTCTLARGCGDSVPALHVLGARLWFLTDFTAGDPREYITGELVSGRLITRSGAGSLASALAPVSTLTLAQRQTRPYPPGALTFNAVAYPAAILGALTTAWAHRDRVTQADQLIDTTAASIGPETGVTYALTVYGEAGTALRALSALTGTSDAWALADEITASALTSPAPARDLVAPPTADYATTVLANVPLGYWRFDETTGTAAADSSGNAYNATTVNCTRAAAALIGNGVAISGDGTSSQVTVGAVAALYNLNRSCSIEAWVAPVFTASGQQSGIWSAGINGLCLRIDCVSVSGSLVYNFELLKDYSASLKTWATQIPNGQRAHVVLTIDASGICTLYINGASVGSYTTTATFGGGYVRIGADGSNSTTVALYLFGRIDEVAAYASILSAAQVLADYNAGAASGVLTIAPEPRANGTLRAVLKSTRSAIDCAQPHDVTVARAGYAYQYGNFYGGT